METIPGALDRALRSGLLPEKGSVLLAVSGGPDSLALLHGCAEMRSRSGWRLSVAHVHHGWRGREADRDLAFVKDHARRLGLPFFERRGDARAIAREERLSPEAGARRLRYGALLEMAREADASRIATAHQLDDRLECLLLARERRGGIAALAGPRLRREDGVVRPLLCIDRQEILEFLRRRGLSYRRDGTNGDLRLPRNRIRRELSRRPETRGALVAEALAVSFERDRLDAEFAARVRPGIATGPGRRAADAEMLGTCPPELRRRAVEELALPFAPPGRAPLTGAEREAILLRLATGRDFRFEARRRIRFERRGRLLSVGLSESIRRVYHGEPKIP